MLQQRLVDGFVLTSATYDSKLHTMAARLRDAVPHSSGHAAAQKLLSRKRPPTAIYTVTDLLAFGILDGARAVGARVPDDVWVVGFDNTEMAAWESFDLTSVDQPAHAIVETGIRLLRDRIADPDRPPQVVTLPCPLVVRGSTANTPVS